MNKKILTTYLKLCTEFYDLELKDNQETQKALEFYMGYALNAHGSILEPMCGTGRFLIPMIQAGCDVEGFDASYYMLDALRQKYAILNTQEAPVWQQFIQDFNNNKKYKLIFIPYGSWGLIRDRHDMLKSLKNMFEHLDSNGKFLIEIETVASAPTEHGIWRRGVHRRDKTSQIAVNTLTSYNNETQIFTSICRYELLIDGVITITETEDFQQYLYRYDELDTILHDIGFSQVKKYKDFSKTPVTGNDNNDPVLIYECIK